MANLTIERGGKHMSLLSKFKVSVDGAEVAKLGQGKSETIEVDPGTHTVQVHSMGTDGSTEVEVSDSGLHLIVGYRSVGKDPQVEFWTADES